MDNKERLRKWLWLGLDETTAKSISENFLPKMSELFVMKV